MERTGRYGPCPVWTVEDEAIRKRNEGVYEKLAMVNQWSFALGVNENERSAGCEGSRLWKWDGHWG
jgi:hypothetical protein